MVKVLSQKTDNIVLVIDSCHSGTVSRGALIARGANQPFGPAKCPAGGCRADAGQGEGADPAKFVLLTASRPDQLAYEKTYPNREDEAAGLLTDTLVSALSALPSGATYDALMARMRAAMQAYSGTQDPTFEGDGGKVIFGSARGAADAGYMVRKRRGAYEISGGLSSGFAVGTVLGVFPYGTGKAETAISAPLQLRLTAVGVAVSTGVPLNAEQAATPGVQAIETDGGAAYVVKHRFGQQRIRVDARALPEALKTALENVPGVERVSDGTASDFVVRKEARGDGEKTVETLSLIDDTGRAVPLPTCVDQDPLRSVPAADALGWVPLSNALEFALRKRRLVAATSGGGVSDVEGRLRVRTGAQNGPSNPLVLQAGTSFALEVTNQGETTFYPYILEFATDGSVGVMYPYAGRPVEALAPGRTVSFPNYTAGKIRGHQQFALLASKEPIADIAAIGFAPFAYRGCAQARGEVKSTPTPPRPWSLYFVDVFIEQSISRGAGEGSFFYGAAPRAPSTFSGGAPTFVGRRVQPAPSWSLAKSLGAGVLAGAVAGAGVMVLTAEETAEGEQALEWSTVGVGALVGAAVGVAVGLFTRSDGGGRDRPEQNGPQVCFPGAGERACLPKAQTPHHLVRMYLPPNARFGANYRPPQAWMNGRQVDPNTRVASNFTFGEFTSQALRHEDLVVLQPYAVRGLQEVRDAVGGIRISSGFRSPAHNRSVGGKRRSRHMYGDAFDIGRGRIPQRTIMAACKAAGADYVYAYRKTGHVHCDWRNGTTSRGVAERASAPLEITLFRQADGALTAEYPAFAEGEPTIGWRALDAAGVELARQGIPDTTLPDGSFRMETDAELAEMGLNRFMPPAKTVVIEVTIGGSVTARVPMTDVLAE